EVEGELATAAADQRKRGRVGEAVGRDVEDRVVPFADGVVGDRLLPESHRACDERNEAEQREAETERTGSSTRLRGLLFLRLLGLASLLAVILPGLVDFVAEQPQSAEHHQPTERHEDWRGRL